MQINFTFCIQIINFLITYWFLNKFLFRPALLYLKKSQDSDDLFKKEICDKKEILLLLGNEKEEEKIDFQKAMQIKYQIQESRLVDYPEIKSSIITDSDKKQIEQLISQTKDVLVKRVPNVD